MLYHNTAVQLQQGPVPTTCDNRGKIIDGVIVQRSHARIELKLNVEEHGQVRAASYQCSALLEYGACMAMWLSANNVGFISTEVHICTR